MYHFLFCKLTCAIAYLNVWLSVPPRPKPEGKKRIKIKHSFEDIELYSGHVLSSPCAYEVKQ